MVKIIVRQLYFAIHVDFPLATVLIKISLTVAIELALFYDFSITPLTV